MTAEEAIAIARSVAERQGWPWQEPILAKRYRTFVLFGKSRWHVMTKADHRGGNVNVHLNDLTGEIVAKGFAQR
jgi:hypothetical protein